MASLRRPAGSEGLTGRQSFVVGAEGGDEVEPIAGFTGEEWRRVTADGWLASRAIRIAATATFPAAIAPSLAASIMPGPPPDHAGDPSSSATSRARSCALSLNKFKNRLYCQDDPVTKTSQAIIGKCNSHI